MMRRRVVIPALTLTAFGVFSSAAVAQFSDPRPPVKSPTVEASQRFNAQQIDNLTGPVALYPDALLAQVLVASTFPDQVQDAADFVRANGTDSIDVQSWDISVKAVAHYPSALNAMADKIDWTSALGKAYATQSSDVMASVQRLRRLAADQGNLNSSAQQKVVTSNETYQIVPVDPQVIYVPVYDPYVIYSRPIFNVGYGSRYWSFGVGFPIGSWLIYDCDWGLRRVYYNGWSPSYYAYGGGWRQRSRPFIQITNIYVNPRYTNVYVNRNVTSYNVNYYNVDRYTSVHSGRYFDNRRDGRYDPRDDGRNGSRYAVRNDGNNGAGAVNGGGYRSGTPTTGNRDYTNNGGNNRGNSSGNTSRDGSGYGGSSRTDNGSGTVNRGTSDNRGGTVNRAGNENRTANDGSVRDGNGNRVGNPNARPPVQRRPEPADRANGQLVVPQRRGEPQQPQQPQAPRPTQDNAPRQAAPRIVVPQPRAGSSSGQLSAPEQRRAEPRQVESRSAPKAVKVPPAASSSDDRTAKRRDGN